MGAGGLKVASMVAQAPAPGLKYLGDQEASLGQELVGWGKAVEMGESHRDVWRPPPMMLPLRCLLAVATHRVVKF